MKLFWLTPALESLQQARRLQRFPHALLIHDAPGGGGDILAGLAAQTALCSAPQAPCGQCRDCRRVQAGQHPDLLQIGPLGDSQQIRVDQIRDLAAQLALTSHGAGASVAIISPAEAMNANAANALLKTLEEPRPGVTLILVTSVPSRLPATIRSRCQRLHVRPPARAACIAWLREQRGEGSWDAVLDVLGNAPLAAVAIDPGELIRVRDDTFAALDEALAGRLDIPGAAERWVRDGFELRLACAENWITGRMERAIRGRDHLAELRTDAHLPAAPSAMNIRSLIGLIDALHEFARLTTTSMNKAIALEQLLWQLPRGVNA
jgi:DNA polymerase-3 subunit delta'